MKKVTSTPKQTPPKPKLHNNSNNKLPQTPETFDISVDILSSRLNLGEGKGIFLSNVLKYKKKKSNKDKDAKASKNTKKKERKAKRLNNHKKKGSGTTNHNHRQRKRRVPDLVEVTTCAIDILESKSDMDEQYLILKERVLSKLPCPEQLIHISLSTKLEERISNIFETSPDPELNTLYLVDLTTVIIKYKDWVECLPNVEPFYAMKCNPDDNIVSTLVACGAGLDCASMEEMKVALSKGLTGDKIIFANPCKMQSHIKFAKDNGIYMMTFDNKAELLKVHSIHPNAKMVLRILGDDSHSTMRFGSKFGANVHTEARPLLECAYSLGLEVIGVSFHVGSGCQSAEAYTNSLSLALHVFDIAAELGHPMSFLDIGGGTPGVDTDELKFSEIAKTVSRDLKQMFPPNVRVIAEPGRYFASECVVLVTSVIAKRERTFVSEEVENNKEVKRIDYYISDGVYGSFNNLFFDHANALPMPMHRTKKSSPTRDDGEIIQRSGSEPIPVPSEDNQQDSDSSDDNFSWGSPPSSYPDLQSDVIFENRENGSSSSNVIEEHNDPATVAPALQDNNLESNNENNAMNKNRSTVFGPTCDSIDLICKDVELPDLEIGDFVYFMNMGAYTSAAASSFNGFKPPQTVYMIS